MNEKGLSYDDVLLVPQYSDIESRAHVNTDTKIGSQIIKYPLVSANMDTITGVRMGQAMYKAGAFYILNRHQYINYDFDDWSAIIDKLPIKSFCVGVKQRDKDFIEYVAQDDTWERDELFITIDVAHGHSKAVIEQIRHIRSSFSKLQKVRIIAGNIATHQAAVDLIDAGADALKIGIGPGCFAAGTRVLMANGFYKNIEEIKAGDLVINMHGSPVKVKKAFKSGYREVVSINTSLSPKNTYATPDHRYFCGDLSSVSEETFKSMGYKKTLERTDKTKSEKLKWLEIGNNVNKTALFPSKINFNLSEYFEIQIKKRSGGNGQSPETTKYATDATLLPTYEVGYIFGTFLGDGHAMQANNGNSNIGAVHWYFNSNEKHVAAKLINCIEKTFDKTPKIKSTNNVDQVILYYKPLADFLANFGKKENKHLPEDLLVNNKLYLSGILDGLVDSDGYVGKDFRTGFINTSLKLVELFNVLNYLVNGYFPNSSHREPTAGGLKIENIENLKDCYTSRTIKKPERRKLEQGYQINKILSCERSNVFSDVYDLEIDCPTHSFIADNAVVHNSLCTTRLATGCGYPQLSAIYNINLHLLNTQLRDKVTLIADGGIRYSGDIVKALAAGADMVMLGNLLAGTVETPGDIYTHPDGKKYKVYRGQASYEAQADQKKNNSEIYAEGVYKETEFNNRHVAEIVDDLMKGVRSGMSYCGARTITELRDKARFVQVTNATISENRPHGTN